MREREELHNPHMGNCITSVTDFKGKFEECQKSILRWQRTPNCIINYTKTNTEKLKLRENRW